MSKVEIDKDGHITFDVVDSFPQLDDGQYTDIELDIEVVNDWMNANPGRSICEFGDFLVEAIKAELDYD